MYFELKRQLKAREKTNQMIWILSPGQNCPFLDLLESEVFTAVKIQIVFFSFMKMEAAFHAETPTRLHKTIILNKIYNPTVCRFITWYCSPAASTGSQSWKTFKLTRITIYFASVWAHGSMPDLMLTEGWHFLSLPIRGMSDRLQEGQGLGRHQGYQ